MVPRMDRFIKDNLSRYFEKKRTPLKPPKICKAKNPLQKTLEKLENLK